MTLFCLFLIICRKWNLILDNIFLKKNIYIYIYIFTTSLKNGPFLCDSMEEGCHLKNENQIMTNKLSESNSFPKKCLNFVRLLLKKHKNLSCLYYCIFSQKDNVGCKWLHTIQCYKARPVAKGYTKTYGFNYQETFTLVAKINIGSQFSWILQQ